MTAIQMCIDQVEALVGQIEYPAKVQGGEAFFVVKDAENGKKLGDPSCMAAELNPGCWS
jgi:hypothetical protein